MKRKLTLVVLSLTLFALPCLSQQFPTVVASVQRPNNTAPIAKTALFTPSADGLFRVSIYMVTTVPVSGTLAEWESRLQWTDDAGVWTNPTVAAVLAGHATNSALCCLATPNLTFWAKAGSPISYAVRQIDGNAAGSTYQVFITVEQLM